MKIETSLFGTLNDGRKVQLYTLTNQQITLKIMNYGATITQIMMPDKNGVPENVVCGFNRLEDYLSEAYLSSYPYFGAIIGRFGNRISKGQLRINGQDYSLAINNGPNHLHGGTTGFDRRLFDAETFEEKDKVGVKLSYLSPDGEENYPGNLKVSCTYSLNKQNELAIEYHAETDKTTVVNLTNHSYFNLSGGKENILNHTLQLNADKMTEMEAQIPTGKIVPVAGTAYDFTKAKKIGRDMENLPTGYDDNYVLDNEAGKMKHIATLSEEKSGRRVEVFTTQPGVQVYTGYWNPTIAIDGKEQFGPFSGIALETQHYPDSVHQPSFPTTLLQPGETLNEKTIYQFLVF